MIAGLPLVDFYPELKNHYLLCATETTARADMDALVKEIIR
jgi:glycine dehydrogenase subunit 1